MADTLEEPTPKRNADFVERQVLFVQQQLRSAWQRKHGYGALIPCIPFYWVFSRLLRLFEEYPDGLTEAVVVTEMTKSFEEKVARDTGQEIGVQRTKRKVRDGEAMGDLCFEGTQEVLQAKVIGYGDHRVTIEIKQANNIAHMYLHQRFRSCVDFLHQNEPTRQAYPFSIGREIAFTNAKLLERKEVEVAVGKMGTPFVPFTLLPTPYLLARLDETWPLDRKLWADSMSLTQVDQVIAHDPAEIQQLTLKATVLDIGAIRPCQTSLYAHRQVLLLGEVDESSISASSTTQGRVQGSHLMVLWDDQVALSRLFQVGDSLSLFHPFVHVCDDHETELPYLLTDYALHHRLVYYLEYGSATVLFAKPRQGAVSADSSQSAAVDQSHRSLEHPLARVDDIQPGWRNFSLYAHVRRIDVSHESPLLAAFVHAYYDLRTTQSRAIHPEEPCKYRSIVSKYELVVRLHVYMASSSNHLLTIEVTGENAVRALRLLPGQSVFLDGLVAMDRATTSLTQARRSLPQAHASSASTTETFPSASTLSLSPSVVVLCAAWQDLFGTQSVFSHRSTLTLVNTLSGLVNTELHLSTPVWQEAMTLVDMTVAAVGWLSARTGVDGPDWTVDTQCAKGQATLRTHTSCARPLVTTSSERWHCLFCHEGFVKLNETQQTYQELVVTLEKGQSQMLPVVALCQGATVEKLLGLSSTDYAQLSRKEKRWTLDRMGGQVFRLVLSRCEPRHVLIPLRGTVSSVMLHVRIDMVQPVNTVAAAHRLLAVLNPRR